MDHTHEVRGSSPFAPTILQRAGESEKFYLVIPAWEIEGYLEKVNEVLIPTDASAEEASSPVDGIPPQSAFWASLREIPQAKGSPPVDFCLLKGNIRVQRNTRAVYGVGLRVKKK